MHSHRQLCWHWEGRAVVVCVLVCSSHSGSTEVGAELLVAVYAFVPVMVLGGAWGHAHIHTGGSVSRSGGGVAGVHALFHNRNGSTRGRQGHTLHLCQQQQWDMCTYEPLEEKRQGPPTRVHWQSGGGVAMDKCMLARWSWGGCGQGRVQVG